MLLELAETSQDIRSGLMAAGFRSCFAEEECMRGQSTPTEWDEYERVRRECAREMILSKSPDALLQARRRHLAEVRSDGLYEDFRAGELAASSGPVAEFRNWLRSPRLGDVQRLFVSALRARALDSARGVSSDIEVHLSVGNDFQMAICPRGEFEGRGAEMSGTFYAQLFARKTPAAQPAPPFSQDDMIPYGWAMRGTFSVYSRFTNNAELALSCAAWLQAMTLTIRCLRERGLHVRGTCS